MELTRRPARTVQSKRKYLGDFVGLIGKEFVDEYRREDVLKYKNKLQDEGFEPKTIDTRMMAVVTFFNRWLKIKLGLDAKDWPETHDNDPEPYTDDEAAKLEAASAGEINLLIRTFRQTGCRDMELAHLNDTDLLDSREIYIREVATWAGHDDINVTRSYAAWLDSQSKAARDSANREDTRYLKTGTQGE